MIIRNFMIQELAILITKSSITKPSITKKLNEF